MIAALLFDKATHKVKASFTCASLDTIEAIRGVLTVDDELVTCEYPNNAVKWGDWKISPHDATILKLPLFKPLMTAICDRCEPYWAFQFLESQPNLPRGTYAKLSYGMLLHLQKGVILKCTNAVRWKKVRVLGFWHPYISPFMASDKEQVKVRGESRVTLLNRAYREKYGIRLHRGVERVRSGPKMAPKPLKAPPV